jgi:hypothetical protein
MTAGYGASRALFTGHPQTATGEAARGDVGGTETKIFYEFHRNMIIIQADSKIHFQGYDLGGF